VRYLCFNVPVGSIGARRLFRKSSGRHGVRCGVGLGRISERMKRGRCSDMEGSVGSVWMGDTCGGLDTIEDASYCYVLYVLTNPKRRGPRIRITSALTYSQIYLSPSMIISVLRGLTCYPWTRIYPHLPYVDGTARVTDYVSRTYL